MQNRLTSTISIFPSFCNVEKALSMFGAFVLFMDAAAAHAEQLGVGCDAMAERRQFWLTARTRVHFYRRPAMMEEVQISTWPGKPAHFFCNRYYTLEKGGELLAAGRTEWAVLDTETGRPARTEDIYPPAFSHLPDVVLPEPFLRFRDDFTEEEKITELTVTSSDIDIGCHVNNTLYVRMLFNTFTVGEVRNMKTKELEVQYVTPCYEGERLSLYRRACEEGYRFAIRKGDGQAALFALLTIETN